MTTPPHVKRAVAAHTERLLAAGGSRVTLKLSPEATAALDERTRKTGLSRTAVIERLLIHAPR